MKGYICMRWLLLRQDVIPSNAESPPASKADVLPEVLSWDADKVVLSVPSHDPASQQPPAEVRIVAYPSGSPGLPPEEAVTSGYPQTVVPLSIASYGSDFEVAFPSGAQPGDLADLLVGYRDDS